MSRAFVIVAAVLLGGIAVWFLKPVVHPVGSTVIATPAPELRLEPGVERPISKIKTYRSSVKKNLALPDHVTLDEKQQIVSSSVVKSDLHPHRITTTINTQTGESETFDQRLPLPLVAFQQRGEVSVGYGYKYSPKGAIEGKNGMVGRLSGRYELMQVKNAGLGVTGTVDSDGDVFAGVELRVRF